MILLCLMIVGQWTTGEPVRVVSAYSPLLNDLESNTPAALANRMRERDKGDWAHYMSHGANSRYRNEAMAKGFHSAVYCFGGRVYQFPRTNVRLSQIAKRVPADERDYTYRVYFIRFAKYWEDNPWFLADDAMAYLARAKVNREYHESDLQDFEMLARFVWWLTYFTKLEPRATGFADWYAAQVGDFLSE